MLKVLTRWINSGLRDAAERELKRIIKDVDVPEPWKTELFRAIEKWVDKVF